VLSHLLPGLDTGFLNLDPGPGIRIDTETQEELGLLALEAPGCWPPVGVATPGDDVVGSAYAAAATGAFSLLTIASADPEDRRGGAHIQRLVESVERSWRVGKQDEAVTVVLRALFSALTSSTPSSHPHPHQALAQLLARIPGEYVEVAPAYIASAALPDASLGVCLARMLRWRLDSGEIARWVSNVMYGVATRGRLVLLTQAATRESPGLVARLGESSLGPYTIEVLETLLGGAQFTPAAFHATLPLVPKLLTALQGSTLLPRVTLFQRNCNPTVTPFQRHLTLLQR